MERRRETVVSKHLDKQGKTPEEIMYPTQVIYQTGSGEYVHFSTDKPARGTEYTVITRENKAKETE